MKSLYALASHFAGDFPLQTNEMAAEKLDDPVIRAYHVVVYTSAYIPALLTTDWSFRQQLTFCLVVALTHFVIDSCRWSDEVPIWFDQAFHVIALAIAEHLSSRVA